MKTEEDFKKVKRLKNGEEYQFIRILDDSEIDLLTDRNDPNYDYYKVLGKHIEVADDGTKFTSKIYHDLNGIFSYSAHGSINLVFPNDL
jgi:hypothetical protein